MYKVCYTSPIINTQSLRNCSQCNSQLILVTKVTEKLEGYRYPQTSSTYRCPNEECQQQKDKETAKRIKLKEDREENDKKREALKREKKEKIAMEVQ